MNELELHMPYLMQLLKKYRDTYSDTPGKGNMDPYQFPQSTYGYNQAQIDGTKLFQGQQQLLQKYPMSQQERYALEGMLMDKNLNALDQQRRMQQFNGTMGPRFEGNWMGSENPLDDVMRKAFRRGYRAM